MPYLLRWVLGEVGTSTEQRWGLSPKLCHNLLSPPHPHRFLQHSAAPRSRLPLRGGRIRPRGGAAFLCQQPGAVPHLRALLQLSRGGAALQHLWGVMDPPQQAMICRERLGPTVLWGCGLWCLFNSAPRDTSSAQERRQQGPGG